MHPLMNPPLWSPCCHEKRISDKYFGSSIWPVRRFEKGESHDRLDEVAEEVPVALVYNGISHVVMLATPADLEDFALGFSLTEGILASPEEMFACEIVEAENGIRIELDISSERFLGSLRKDGGQSGRPDGMTGLCGTDSLSQAVRIPAPVTSSQIFSVETLHSGFDQMEKMQVLKQVDRRDTCRGMAGRERSCVMYPGGCRAA